MFDGAPDQNEAAHMIDGATIHADGDDIIPEGGAIGQSSLDQNENSKLIHILTVVPVIEGAAINADGDVIPEGVAIGQRAIVEHTIARMISEPRLNSFSLQFGDINFTARIE